LNLEELKEILRIVEAGDFQEVELERDGLKLRVVKGARETRRDPERALPRPAEQASLPPPPAEGGAEAASQNQLSEEAGLTQVSSPIVGTFYRSPDPNSSPFVSVGDRVKVGQVLCIIEAMKLMNEIESEVVGEVVKIHVENGQPVQYGDPLFSLRVS
jgi:acetyl-CoA carboxylase biotin carboxyl carrier protein